MNPSTLVQPPPGLSPSAKTQRRSRRWLPYVGALLLAALITAGLWPKPVPVETARAVLGPLRVMVSEEGKTRVKQRYLVSAPVTGFLRRIPFKAGAEIQGGQTVLAVIEPVLPALLDARARSLAEARRDTAAANLTEAREKLARDAATASAHDLAYRLARLAEYEGHLFVLTEVVRLIEAGKADQLDAWLMMHATRGAEDSWSGRTNDAARSRFDGVLAAIRKVSETLAER